MGYFGIPIRNGLPIGLGSLAGFGIRSFDPSELFATGEQGTWYDPSDFSTLFQDSAGTTPVTGVEQVVGLMLDKSKGLVLGPELFSTFGTVTAPWTAQGGGVWSIDGSQAGTRDLSQTLQYTTNRFYVTRFTLSGVTGGSVNVFAGEGTIGPAYGNGTFTIRSYSSQAYLIFRAPAGVAATVSNISVRELPGNHATATGSARPTLSARVNLLVATENFGSASWNKNASTFSGTTLTSTGTSEASVNQAIGSQPNTTYVFTVRASKGSAGTFMYVRNILVNDGAPSGVATFNLESGTVVYSGSAYSSVTIADAGGGLYDCTVVGTKTGATAANRLDIGITTSSTGGLTCTVGNFINLYRTDLRVTNDGVGIPAYQRVNTATDYDTAGFPVYLAFGGAQAMSTPANVDFSGTDKMTVFAGVRKLGTTDGMLTEISVDAGANNGTFYLGGPLAAGAWQYAGLSRGTANGVATVTSGYASPVTNVITMTANIAGDSTVLRLNGTQAANATNDQGTGNYGSYPLYIGARNLASLFFTGRLYSLITQGAATDSASVAATEAWVNQRTAAY